MYVYGSRPILRVIDEASTVVIVVAATQPACEPQLGIDPLCRGDSLEVVKRGSADSDLKRYGSLAVGQRYAGEEAVAQTLVVDCKLSTKEVNLDLHGFAGCACTFVRRPHVLNIAEIGGRSILRRGGGMYCQAAYTVQESDGVSQVSTQHGDQIRAL